MGAFQTLGGSPLTVLTVFPSFFTGQCGHEGVVKSSLARWRSQALQAFRDARANLERSGYTASASHSRAAQRPEGMQTPRTVGCFGESEGRSFGGWGDFCEWRSFGLLVWFRVSGLGPGTWDPRIWVREVLGGESPWDPGDVALPPDRSKASAGLEQIDFGRSRSRFVLGEGDPQLDRLVELGHT